MFIQYVSILVSSPVVSSLLTIIFAPNQLTRMIDAYEVTIITGDTVTMAFSALTKSLYTLFAALWNFPTSCFSRTKAFTTLIEVTFS